MRMRLRTFSLLLIVLVSIIPTSIVALTLYRQVQQFVFNDVDRQLQTTVQQVASELSHRQEVMTNGLQLLSEQDRVVRGIDDLIHSIYLPDILKDFVEATPLIESLYLLGADGLVVEAYQGNILALEQSQILANRYKDPELGERVYTMSQVEVVENHALVQRTGRHSALLFSVPIYSDKAMDRVDVKGYLVAVVPIYKLVDIANGILSNQESFAIYYRQERLEGNVVGDASHDVTHSSRVAFSGHSYQNAVWLTVMVGQDIARLEELVQEALRPSVISGALILLAVFIAVMLMAHFAVRAFGGLYALLTDFELGKNIERRRSSRFSIMEFAHVEELLGEMKDTIGEQLRTVNQKNQELARVDELRAAYLEEVQSLNNELEFKVEERTQELEASMTKLAGSNLFFEQLVQFRRTLEASGRNRQVISASLHLLSSSFPEWGMAIQLPKMGEHRLVQQSVGLDKLDFDVINKRIPEYRTQRWERTSIELDDWHPTVFAIPSGQNQLGWLLVDNAELDEERSNQVLLVVAELSAYLENRALNEELAYLARVDSLTGLLNRKSFDELQFELSTQLDADIGLVIIDVNGLKQTNDQRGHQKGDMLIRSVAKQLQECCLDITQSLFRIGGDEFAIVMHDTELVGEAALLERLANSQNSKLSIALDAFGGEPLVSFSFGYARSSEQSLGDLYKLADQKMYENKRHYYQLRRQAEL